MKALLLIDIQKGLTKRKGLYNVSVFFDTVNDAIAQFRNAGNLIVFVQHNNKFLINGESDWEIDSRIEKRCDDKVVQKFHGNAFKGTDLKSVLEGFHIKEIVVCGLVSHGCVKATCIGGLSLGFKYNPYALRGDLVFRRSSVGRY
jgi:nicotinamidase-related amidase